MSIFLEPAICAACAATRPVGPEPKMATRITTLHLETQLIDTSNLECSHSASISTSYDMSLMDEIYISANAHTPVDDIQVHHLYGPQPYRISPSYHRAHGAYQLKFL